MKTFSLILLIFLFNSLVIAQSKVINLKLERNERTLQVVNLGDQGILIKTGKEYRNSKKLGWKLKYYSPTLELKWEAPISRAQILKGFTDEIVASPESNYIYHIENDFKKRFLTVIDKGGKIRTHEVENIKDFGFLQMTFCDNKYLYFLATENGNETDDKKKAEEKLILNKIDNKDFSYKKIILNLPKIEDPEHSTFWEYVEHNNEKIFLSSKTVNIETGQIKYNIIAINSDGEILSKVSIDASLDGKNIRPSYNMKSFHGKVQEKNNDFMEITNTSNGMVTTTMEPRLGAFGGVLVNPKNEAIYIYGLYGSKPFKKVASVYEGYFIYKYDLKGNNVFKIMKDVPAKLSQESFFKIHGTPYDRNLLLKVNSDNSLMFYIGFKKQIYSFGFSKDGELIKEYANKFSTYVDSENIYLCSSTLKTNKAIEYLKSISKDKKKSKNTSFQLFCSTKGTIIIEENLRTLKLNFLFFEK